MLSGISPMRLALYGLAVAALLALNLLRLQDTEESEGTRRSAAPAEVTQMPRLFMARDFAEAADLGTRDLFSRRPLAPERPTAPAPQPVAVAPPPNPYAQAMALARRELGDMKLIGVMSAQEGSLAVLYHKGNTTNRAVGDEVVPGFTLDRITRDDVQLSNQSVGISAILSIGGRKPMQLIRVE